VSSCPVCATNGIYASHRRGVLERGPLSWIGVFPFRCGQCNARFYRFAPGAKRRRVERTLVPTGSDHLRPLRWSIAAEATVTLYREDGSTSSFLGRVENASSGGMGVLLPMTLPEGSVLNVEIPDMPSRLGTVRWVKAGESEGTLHGLEFESAAEAAAPAYRPSLAKRARRIRRRVFVGVISLALLALAAYGLVWLIEEFRAYRPRYYEPKDIERQQFQQRQGGETPPNPASR
jgi:PilZ domain